MAGMENPFRVGDRVTFNPAERVVGWSWSYFDRVRLHPGESGVVTRISDGEYLWLDDERGGFHWECYSHTE